MLDGEEWGNPLFTDKNGGIMITEKIRNLIESEIKNNGYILTDVLYERENGNNFLRIVIDKEGFIDLEDCIKVTNLINPIIDEADPIEENYIMDVCSKEKGCE